MIYPIQIFWRITLAVTLFLGSVSISHASDKWQPVIDFEAKLGSSRDLGTTRAMVPLRQSEDGLLFGDVRFTKDSLGNHEYNVGAGLRHQLSTNTGHRFIIGGYGFYDFRRSDNNVNHQQITIGGELLTTNWDFRANVYQPLTGAEVVGSAGGSPSINLVDQQLVFDPDNGQIIEDPLHGFDVEAGRKLPFYSPVSLFGAYYNFDSSQAEQVEGYRIRGEWELNDYLTMTAEHSQDGVRDDTQFIGLRLRVPLQRFTGGDDTDRPALTGLDDRMMEPVIRDVDIVTGTTQDPGDAPAPLQRADSSGPARVIYVDNSNDGDPAEDGSTAHPFNTLQEGIDAASDYDTVYIRAGDGTAAGYTPATTYTITKSMRIIGEGAALTLDLDYISEPTNSDLSSLAGQVFIPAGGSQPTIGDNGDPTRYIFAGDNAKRINLQGMEIENTVNPGRVMRVVNVDQVDIQNIPYNRTIDVGGGEFYTQYQVGQIMEFDTTGANGILIPAGGDNQLSSEISMTAWVNMRSDNVKGRKILCKYYCGSSGQIDYRINIYPSNLQANVKRASSGFVGASGNETPLNTWRFVAGTYDGNIFRIYNNATQTGSDPGSGTIDITANKPLLIGNNGKSGGGIGFDDRRNFDGFIDDPRLYNHALSPAEITDLFNQGR